MLDKVYQKLINLSKFSKIICQVNYDVFTVFGCLVLMKNLDTSFYIFYDFFILFCAAIFFAITSFLFGLYKSFVRFFATSSLLKTFLITMCTYSLVFLILGDEILGPYSWISSLFFTFSMIALPRIILQELLRTVGSENRSNIAIIGNDYESYELFDLLKHSKKYIPVCFLVNNNKGLFFKNVSFPELTPLQFLKQTSKLDISLILAHEITVQKPWFNPLIESVESSKIPFFKSKGIDEAVRSQNEKIKISPLSLLDLAIRSPQPPIKKLLKRNIYGKTILVTGGGGSIGSELCKQIFLQDPKKIIIVDSSEYNLYQIEEEILTLTQANNLEVETSNVLCSVLDKELLEKTFENNKVDTVFHAAAYKHVPIVEKNPLAGFENNVFGTKNIANLSVKFKVKTFILVSTDKAVNPTNIMGVTKRLAEMFCQSLAENSEYTNFAIIRFGNVLGSSGSVIPKFENQINSGGPITVTHQNINRFFMSITEAAQLVIQASAMNTKCEFFVLDMGKPINILDLAKRMCTIRGLSYYCIEEGSSIGDIEIRITGLRGAEKMYEEVLATNTTFSTEHPSIFSAHEDFIKHDKLCKVLDELKVSLKQMDGKKLKKIFSSLPQVNYCHKNMIEFCKDLKKT